MSGRAQKAEAEGRDKMVRTTEKAVAGTTKLEQGLAVLAETEEIGVSVIDNMTQQREQLIRTRDKASDISTLAEQAKGIVRGIQARAVTNKFILGARGGSGSGGGRPRSGGGANAEPRLTSHAHMAPALPPFPQVRLSSCCSARSAASCTIGACTLTFSTTRSRRCWRLPSASTFPPRSLSLLSQVHLQPKE
jgi:hypothetical protein